MASVIPDSSKSVGGRTRCKAFPFPIRHFKVRAVGISFGIIVGILEVCGGRFIGSEVPNGCGASMELA